MNSYKAEIKNISNEPKSLKLDLEIDLGFGLSLKKSLYLADIVLDIKYRVEINHAIMIYCYNDTTYNVNITVNEKDEVFVFNGVDNNHLNAVLVEKGYATFI